MRLARILYVEQGKTAKDTAEMVGVSEATVSKWVNKYNWKGQRAARLTAPMARTENIKQIINQLTEDRILYSQELREAEHNKDAKLVMELYRKIAQVDDAVSKWNKTLTNIDKENRITLSVYLQVMEMLFDELKRFDETLYIKMLDFQEVHLNDVSLRFK